MPAVISVAKSPTHAFSKQVQASICLIAGEGVEGDAHRGRTTQHLYLKRRNAAAPNLTQVHLFAAEMLDEFATNGYTVRPGECGENILTRGLDLLALPQAALLYVGPEAVVQVTGLRTPCIRVDRFQPGLQRLMWGTENSGRVRRAGIMGIVRRGGPVFPGDAIRAEFPAGPYRALEPV